MVYRTRTKLLCLAKKTTISAPSELSEVSLAGDCPQKWQFPSIVSWKETRLRLIRKLECKTNRIIFSLVIFFVQRTAKLPCLYDSTFYTKSQLKKTRIQPVSATPLTSNGVRPPRRFLGLPFKACSTFASSASETSVKSVFFGKKSRSRPLAFSFAPRSAEQYGCA